MSKSIYLLVGAAAGAAAVYLYFNAPQSSRTYGSFGESADAIGDAAGKATRWGTGQRVSGSGTQVLGKFKQTVGEATGNEQLANAGVFDQAKGIVKDAAGQAAHAAVDVVHELNR
jgi:uncharacterized protein YjbJ (UPF0337 family)